MAKKCIPGVFCVGNMTLFVLVLILLGVVYLVIQMHKNMAATHTDKHTVQQPIIVNTQPAAATLTNITSDLALPPLKIPDIFGLPSPSTPGVNIGNPMIHGVPVVSSVVQVPVQVPTRGYPTGYQQMGILTSDVRKDMILPLMGRRTTTGRDKWQYYTTTNTGAIQTKLPVKRSGRSCTGEYGCDELYDGDSVFVEGYKEVFRATIYENAGLSYMPY
jgi:hypothetical protein